MLEGIAAARKFIDLFDMGRGKYNQYTANVKVSELIDKETYETLLDEYEKELAESNRTPVSREASSKKYTSLTIPYIYPALKVGFVDGKPTGDYIPIKEKVLQYLGIVPLTHSTGRNPYYEPLEYHSAIYHITTNLTLSKGEEFLRCLAHTGIGASKMQELFSLWEETLNSPEDKELVENFKTFEEKSDWHYT